MSNSNSVAGFAQSGTLRNQWPTQTVATTTETAFLINTDTGTSTGFVVAPTGGQIYGAQTKFDVNANTAITERSGREYGLPSGETNDIYSSASWDGRPFKVRMTGVGNVGANAAQSLVIKLYQGTSATLASDKEIGLTGAALATVAGGPFNFTIEAALLWDATSQILSGSYTANIAFGTVSQFTTTTVVPNVVTAVTAADLSFLGSITLGAAASSTVAIREFVIDKV